MSTYRAKTGTDQTLGSLTVLDPQPRSVGLQVTRRTHAASGAVYDEGLYVELLWDYLDDASTYQTVLTVFGLNAARYAAVTVYVRSDQFSWTRYNGIAVRPEIGRDAAWNQFFPRGISILVKDLTVAS